MLLSVERGVAARLWLNVDGGFHGVVIESHLPLMVALSGLKLLSPIVRYLMKNIMLLLVATCMLAGCSKPPIPSNQTVAGKAYEKMEEDRRNANVAMKNALLAQQQRQAIENDRILRLQTLQMQQNQVVLERQQAPSQSQQPQVYNMSGMIGQQNKQIDQLNGQMKQMQDNQPQKWHCSNCGGDTVFGTRGDQSGNPSSLNCGPNNNFQKHEWHKV